MAFLAGGQLNHHFLSWPDFWQKQASNHCNRRHRLRRSLAQHYRLKLGQDYRPNAGSSHANSMRKGTNMMITLWWWLTFCHGTWSIYRGFTSQNADFLYFKLPKSKHSNVLFSYNPHSRWRGAHTNLQQGMLGIILQQQNMFNETILWSHFF